MHFSLGLSLCMIFICRICSKSFSCLTLLKMFKAGIWTFIKYKAELIHEKEPYIQITNLKARTHTPSFKKPRNLETTTTDQSKSMDADFLASEKKFPE